MQEIQTQKIFQRSFRASVDGESMSAGRLVLRFCTMDTPDAYDTIFERGCFGEQRGVMLGVWNHGTAIQQGGDALPIGAGRIYEDGVDAVAEMEAWLDDPAAQRHWNVMSRRGSDQEFSFFFIEEDGHWDEGYEIYRFTRVLVVEVCPVDKGAGVNTGLLSMRAAPEKPAYGDKIRRSVDARRLAYQYRRLDRLRAAGGV